MNKETVAKVLDSIDDEEIVRLEQNLVRIPSFTYEEARLADYIANYMSDAGIETVLFEVQEPSGGKRKSKQPVGIIRGDGTGTSLMFNGHMDHNPLVGNWSRDPFGGEIEGDWLYGRGSIDEKGGITNLIIAGMAIKQSNLKLKGDLLLCPVMGHKSGGVGTRYNIDHSITADVVINTESSGSGIATCGVGVIVARVTFTGKMVHFRTPEPAKSSAPNAIEKATKFIAALGPNMKPVQPGGWLTFVRDSDFPGFPQFNLDDLMCTRFPDFSCTLQLQIRLVPGQNADTVRADLKSVLRRLKRDDPAIDARLEVPPPGGWDFKPYKVPPDTPFVQSLIRWHTFINGEAPIVGSQPRLGACGDANILANTGVPTVQYGPGAGSAHLQWPTPDERIFLPELIAGAKTIALAAADICGAH